MAYTAPPTKAAGDTLTETNWNTHIKGNFEAGVPDLYTTKGDIAVATAANAAARLAVGANDTTLVADSGEATGLAWQIQPAARVYNSSDIDPAPGGWVTLTFDTERFDTDTVHSTASNTSRLTIPANGDGLYLIGACVEFDTGGLAGSGGHFGVRLILGGATVLAMTKDEMTGSDAFNNVYHVETLYELAATNYVEAQVYTEQDVDVKAQGNYSPEFWCIWTRRP